MLACYFLSCCSYSAVLSICVLELVFQLIQPPLFKITLQYWQARRDSNPQPSVLETDALPVELLAFHYCIQESERSNLIYCCFATIGQIIQAPARKLANPEGRQLPATHQVFSLSYSKILATTPAPTVRPPSRIANRRPSSIAIGAISSTFIWTLSPGITISTPSGNSTAPVTSVVRK